MPWYRYRAQDPDGTWFTSTIEADSAYDAMVWIRESGAELDALERVASPEPTVDRAPDPPMPATLPEPSHRLEPVHDRPPPAPRHVPPGTSGVAGGIVFMAVGGIFTFVAAIFIVVGLGLVASGNSEGWFFAGFPMIHFTIGAVMLIYAIRGRSERRRVVRDGEVALGRIHKTGRNHRVRINGRNPYKMDYEFEVDGETYRGDHSSMNEAMTAHRLHDRIWVLYDPEDPSKNVEWPPF